MTTWDPTALVTAISAQEQAAQDHNSELRLVAGPGSGKSYVIEGRVADLMTRGIDPRHIFAVSFTRAATTDLRERIVGYGLGNGLTGVTDVAVSTLHSLAMKLMRLGNMLAAYPVEPRVVDDWETKHWIDAEFAKFAGVTPTRASEIRRYHEAWWSAGYPNPANYIPPSTPVTAQEQQQFANYHQVHVRFYAAVLLGEIVRACLDHVRAGTLDPQQLLNMEELIVDEYQDLNEMDIALIDELAARGVGLLAAGDDDQSIYSFRYASPAGIQNFLGRYPNASDHQLAHCFRCTPKILNAATSLLGQFGAPGRIPKSQLSMYSSSTPVVDGHAAVWKFSSAVAEARAIAESCADLIARGVKAGKIMILLSNQRALGARLYEELDQAQVPYVRAREEPFSFTDAGRAGLSIVRIALDKDDLVAHRNLLGLQPNVGPTRCLDIAYRAINANVSVQVLFHGLIPQGVLPNSAVLRNAVDGVRAVAASVDAWDGDDLLGTRRVAIAQMVEDIAGASERAEWDAYTVDLLDDMRLQELRDFLYAETLESAREVLANVHERLGLDFDKEDESHVQVMTMHSSKGLSAEVVFIPGLENEIFPGPRRIPVQGLVLEGARMLYVALTRAKAAVICSYAAQRFINGQNAFPHPSQYLPAVGISVTSRTSGLTSSESDAIKATRDRLV